MVESVSVNLLTDVLLNSGQEVRYPAFIAFLNVAIGGAPNAACKKYNFSNEVNFWIFETMGAACCTLQKIQLMTEE